MNLADQITEQILTLQQALLANQPNMPGLLREIHQRLKADPEVVTLLTEDQIAVIVEGLKVHTATSIVTAKEKKTATKLKDVELDDL